jgi:hypothetical protein
MVSIAAIASFGSVVWWAHNQDVRAGGKGLEPLVVQAPATPSRTKPENAGGLVPPNQDKEVYNRIAPGAVPTQPEKLLPGPTIPKLPASGLPLPAAPKPEPEAKTPTPIQPAQPAASASGSGPTPPPAATPAIPPDKQPTVTQAPTPAPASEPVASIASLIEGMSGPAGGWRVQIASVKSEDIAKSTWVGQSPHAANQGRSRRQRRVVPRAGRSARREAGPGRLRHAQDPQDRLRHHPACQAVTAFP